MVIMSRCAWRAMTLGRKLWAYYITICVLFTWRRASASGATGGEDRGPGEELGAFGPADRREVADFATCLLAGSCILSTHGVPAGAASRCGSCCCSFLSQ